MTHIRLKKFLPFLGLFFALNFSSCEKEEPEVLPKEDTPLSEGGRIERNENAISGEIKMNLRGIKYTFQMDVKGGELGCGAAITNSILTASNPSYKGDYARAFKEMGKNAGYNEIVAYLSKNGDSFVNNLTQAGLSNAAADRGITAITNALKRNNAIITLVYSSGKVDGSLVSTGGFAHWIAVVGIKTNIVSYVDPLQRNGGIKTISVANLKASWLGTKSKSYSFKNVNLIEVKNQRLLVPIDNISVTTSALGATVTFPPQIDATNYRIQISSTTDSHTIENGFPKPTVLNFAAKAINFQTLKDGRVTYTVPKNFFPISGSYRVTARYDRESVAKHSEFSSPINFYLLK